MTDRLPAAYAQAAIARAVQYAEAADAPNTLRAYRSDWQAFGPGAGTRVSLRYRRRQRRSGPTWRRTPERTLCHLAFFQGTQGIATTAILDAVAVRSVVVDVDQGTGEGPGETSLRYALHFMPDNVLRLIKPRAPGRCRSGMLDLAHSFRGPQYAIPVAHEAEFDVNVGLGFRLYRHAVCAICLSGVDLVAALLKSRLDLG